MKLIRNLIILALILGTVWAVRHKLVTIDKPKIIQQVEQVKQLQVKAPKPVVKQIQVIAPKPVLDVPTLFADINKERVAAGLPALIETPSLETSAAAKCADMEARDYWAHNTPDGKTPWTFFTTTWPHKEGENLAKMFQDSESVTQGWMNSPTHKANILEPSFTNVGYAICNGPQVNLVVQHFGG